MTIRWSASHPERIRFGGGPLFANARRLGARQHRGRRCAARQRAAARARDRHHRAGRLVSGGAAAREGLPGHRHGARRQRASARAAPSTCAGASGCCGAIRSTRTVCAARSRRPGHTSSTISPRRRSCRPHGSSRCRRSTRSPARPWRSLRPCARSTSASGCSWPHRGRCSAKRPKALSARTPRCRPTSPYAVAKLAAHQMLGVMRERDELFARSGILDNHESERRPEQFVTRKISRGAAGDQAGSQDELLLGDLDAVRDWSFAGDMMLGAWLMLRQERARDCVLASGVGHTVREFAEVAFACVGLEAERYLRVDRTLVRGPRRRRTSATRRGPARSSLDPAAELRGAGRAHGAERPACAGTRARHCRARLGATPGRCRAGRAAPRAAAPWRASRRRAGGEPGPSR